MPITLAMVMVFALSSCQRKAASPPPVSSSDFTSHLIAGRNAFENGDAEKAVAAFQRATQLLPTQPDAHLNLANALLFAGQSEQAIAAAEEVLKLSANSAAALYVIGCAKLRLGHPKEALQALEQSQFIEPDVSAVSFQIGRAQQALGQSAEAAAAFGEAISLEPEHPAAHYALSQMLIRLNQPDAAREELQRHQRILAQRPNIPNDPTYFEKCRHTLARLPEVPPEQPNRNGVRVAFVDATEHAFGDLADQLRGPVGMIDADRDGRYGLFAVDSGHGFRLLANENGVFRVRGESLAGISGANYHACLVGDLNNDRIEDVIILSDQGAKVFALAEDGNPSDVTNASGLRAVAATDAVLADLDFTGKLGLVVASEKGISIFRNQGNRVFHDVTAALGMALPAQPARQLAVDDWNGDDLPDLFIASVEQPLQLLLNQHGGQFKPAAPDVARLTPTTDVSRPPGGADAASLAWPIANVLATGDLNNDRRADAALATSEGIEIVFGGLTEPVKVGTGALSPKSLQLIDYDNDGWLDLWACGDAIRVWRNLGSGGFQETSTELGLDKGASGPVDSLAATDFDDDGDTDLVISIGEGGLRFLRNDGGNANHQIKVRLTGKRSNASGLGAGIELIAGGWRTMRRVSKLPVEIGTGKHAQLDSLSVHWADLVMNFGSVNADPKTPIYVTELEAPTGSCPYLYVWNGERFRFVTDLLGASPAGLRISDDRFIDADTEELVLIGDEQSVKPRDGNYVLNITDELRELLFFDEVQLVVVDHPAGTEVHSTSKLRPGKPFVPHELVALSHAHPLLQATRSDGRDVTALLSDVDGRLVSPVKLRPPQLRGLAEPFSVTLDFGPVDVSRPLVLALTGWLRFGGGMANVAASHDSALPFPFPVLEVKTAGGGWQPVDVVAGAPAGKTKSIIIDLTGKLPAGARQLRLGTAFEIHWDRIALLERDDPEKIHVTRLTPETADLHWHGSGEHEDLPWFMPVTPIHDKVRSVAPWLVTPSGWCTRYGDVKELVTKRDNALVILNCGDEVTLTFSTTRLPPKRPGHVREFLIYTSGWDKDADYHVEGGLTVEPLPWHGMDDQLYGRQQRPAMEGDEWIKKYNTRWVGPLTLGRRSAPRRSPAVGVK